MIKEFIRQKLPAVVRIMKISGFTLLFGLLIGAVMQYASAFKVFTLENVKISGNEIVSPDDLFSLSGLKFGENLLNSDIRKATARIESNPFIRKAVISRNLPNSFSIKVEERTPFAFLVIGELYCTDIYGHLLPSRSHKRFDLPVITGIEDITAPKFGDKIDDARFLKALRVAKLLSEGPLPLINVISEIHIGTRGNVNLIGTENSTRIYLGKSNFVNKIDRIRSLVATVNLGDGLSGYQYVDLRFENQVIVKERS